MPDHPDPRIALAFCWCFDDTPEAGLARLASLGYDGFELWSDSLIHWGIDHWAKAQRESGLRCMQLCPYFDFVHGPEAIARSERILSDYLSFADCLQCTRIRVFTGPPWGEGVVGAADATEAQWQACIEHLGRFCGIAARRGVELCLECHVGGLAEDSPSTLRLLRSINQSNLTVNLQIPFTNEPWKTILAALGPYTTHIHIHNWSGEPGESPLTFLGEGTFDWFEVANQLVNRLGRTLCLSVEHATHAGRDDPWETARRDIDSLAALRRRINSVAAAPSNASDAGSNAA